MQIVEEIIRKVSYSTKTIQTTLIFSTTEVKQTMAGEHEQQLGGAGQGGAGDQGVAGDQGEQKEILWLPTNSYPTGCIMSAISACTVRSTGPNMFGP